MPIPKHVFAAITKVDVAARKVTGIAMQEVVDRTNEKCLYEKSKPFWKKWSDAQHTASGGKSKGNLREMHTASAVGIVTELVCDDALKAFVIETEVVDDAAWAKVEKGVYTGFSVGANFGEPPVKVAGVLEWVSDPVEVSLVDVPCVPTALFEMKLADGSTQMRKFATSSQELPPVVKMAPGYAGRRKSMYTVSSMASSLSDLRYIIQDLDWEAEYENDGSKIPDRLRAWLGEGAQIFLDLTEEETSEFAAMITSQKSARAEREKAAVCGCSCDGCSDCAKKKALKPEVEKTETMTPEQTKAFTDATAAMTTATTKMTEAVTKVDGFETRLKALEEKPAPAASGMDAETTKAFNDFMAAFGDQPAPAVVKHTSVPREDDKGNQGTTQEKSDLPAEGADLTNNPEARRKALTAIRHQANA